MRVSHVVWSTIAAAIVLAVGEAVPRLGVNQDLSRYASSPPSLEVATASLAFARPRYASPLDHLLFPAADVRIGVWPASCPRTHLTDRIPNRVYYGKVQLYSLFGIPGPVVEARCGGTVDIPMPVE